MADFNKKTTTDSTEQNIHHNACCNCKEGDINIFGGKSVYCSKDGRRHPLNDNLSCKWFVPKELNLK